MSGHTILWVDNDEFAFESVMMRLEGEGISIYKAASATEALFRLEEYPSIQALIVDIVIPPGSKFGIEETWSGRRAGLVLARKVKGLYPDLKIIGLSVVTDPDVIEWFENYGNGFISKMDVTSPKALSRKILRLILGDKQMPGPRSFIVHGHSNEDVLQLKDFIQNKLQWPEPVVLRDRPSSGRTIIEKFEYESEDIEYVFVLMTPDDAIFEDGTKNESNWRARQNVIFELGFYYGKMQRKSGFIIVLYKGALEIPSDLSGVIYVDISKGIAAASEEIRKEVQYSGLFRKMYV